MKFLNSFTINKKKIQNYHKPFVIAEIGSNHDQDIEKALIGFKELFFSLHLLPMGNKKIGMLSMKVGCNTDLIRMQQVKFLQKTYYEAIVKPTNSKQLASG